MDRSSRPRSGATRRELVATGAGLLALGAAGALTTPAHARLLATGKVRGLGRGRFADGVASGEPGPSAVTFWGRLRTDRPRSAARLVVATDEGLRDVVATTLVPTSSAVDHTLKARVGGLQPSRHYWYAWQSADDVSPVGRTKTAPPADSRQAVAVGFSSCQSYPHGFFNAHADAAAQDLDLYVQLGDYTYEYAFGDYGDLRGKGGVDFASVDLRTYRDKLRLYRADAALRELHRLHPVIHTWDDHEVADNYTDGQPSPSAQQRNAGYRASFEWMPRIAVPGDRFRLFRGLRLGRTVELLMLDERQYRDVAVVGRSILGRRQMEWLKGRLATTDASWKLLGNPDLFAPLGLNPTGEGLVDPINFDGWGGYPHERTEVLQHLVASRIDDVALLTGDVHMFMANDLMIGGRSVATEYMGGSVTSPGLDVLEGTTASVVRGINPHIRFLDGLHHGWAVAHASDQRLEIEFRASDSVVSGAPSRTLARFRQDRGENRVTQVAGATRASDRAFREDPARAPVAPGTPLAARAARIDRAATRDLERRARGGAAERALRADRARSGR
jgi:phosphodiesterase/alkaline phosphatase D-like protein